MSTCGQVAGRGLSWSILSYSYKSILLSSFNATYHNSWKSNLCPFPSLKKIIIFSNCKIKNTWKLFVIGHMMVRASLEMVFHEVDAEQQNHFCLHLYIPFFLQTNWWIHKTLNFHSSSTMFHCFLIYTEVGKWHQKQGIGYSFPCFHSPVTSSRILDLPDSVGVCDTKPSSVICLSGISSNHDNKEEVYNFWNLWLCCLVCHRITIGCQASDLNIVVNFFDSS